MGALFCAGVVPAHRPPAVVALVVALALLTAAAAEDGPRPLLLIHLDAVAADDFDRLMADGRLPNLARVFDGGTSTLAVTLFPACTSIIYPTMRDGSDRHSTRWVGLGGFDRTTGRPVGELEVFLGLVSSVPRRATAAFLHGLPGLDGLGASSLQNVPDLLARYGVVEVLWFAADTAGHLAGEAAHAAAVERFDAAFGHVLPRLDLGAIDVLLYADHGMTFGTEQVDVAAVLADRLGDQVLHVAYPNVYLRDPARVGAAAAALAAPGGLDYVFWRVDEDRVQGYLNGRELALLREAGGVRYESAADALGYARLGYDGQALDDDAWLALTVAATYPAAPPNVFGYLQHPDVGDLVAGVLAPRLPASVLGYVGNHAGLTRGDLVVRVLACGAGVPELGPPAWLHEVLRGLPVAGAAQPARERHELEVRLDLDGSAWLQARWSPEYRVRIAGEVGAGTWAAWTEHDVAASYLTRAWVGGGVTDAGHGLEPLLRGELEFEVGDARLRFEARAQPSGVIVRVGATFRVAPGVRVVWQAPGAVGVGVAW